VRIRRWAEQENHTLIATFSDTVSGSNGADDRPGFLDALDALEDHDADGIVVSSIDRLARKLTTQEALLAIVWNRSGSVFEISLGEIPKDDPDDPYRTFVRQILGAAAQLERTLIVKRMADGRRSAISRGRSIGPAPSFGWLKDPNDGGKLVPDPKTYPLLRRLWQCSKTERPWRKSAHFLLVRRRGVGIPHRSHAFEIAAAATQESGRRK